MCSCPWCWRHDMGTFSALLALREREFTGHRWLPSRIKGPVMRTSNVFSVAGFTCQVAGPIMEWLVQWRPVNGGGYQRFWIQFSWPDDQTSNGSWCMGIKGPTRLVSYLNDIYIYIYDLFNVYSFCLFCCLFIVVTWWYVWCIVWASGNQEEVQACLVTLISFDKNHNHLL